MTSRLIMVAAVGVAFSMMGAALAADPPKRQNASQAAQPPAATQAPPTGVAPALATPQAPDTSPADKLIRLADALYRGRQCMGDTARNLLSLGISDREKAASHIGNACGAPLFLALRDLQVPEDEARNTVIASAAKALDEITAQAASEKK